VRPRVLAALAAAGLLAAAPAEASAGESPQVAIGAYVPAFAERPPAKPAALDRFAEEIGAPPAIVAIYKQWRQPAFPRSELDAIWSRGALPMITWEPFNYEGGRFPLRAIAAGRFDEYVEESARAAVRWGRPVLVRFAHEMNGDWYPWGDGVDGNTPALYRDAWRHVVDVFRRQGASNVAWVWAPQINKDGELPFADFYPGDRWVDWLGLDGYNAGTHGNWDSFTEIFGPSYDELVEISPRPVLITETGASESGGDKPAWVASALEREIPNFPRLRGVVWFNDRFNELDFRIDSSPTSRRAFSEGIVAPVYDETSRRDLLAAPNGRESSASAPEPPDDDYGQPSLLYRLTQKLRGRYLWITVGAVALAAAAALAFVVARRRRPREL
jgi:hypothetical protein